MDARAARTKQSEQSSILFVFSLVQQDDGQVKVVSLRAKFWTGLL